MQAASAGPGDSHAAVAAIQAAATSGWEIALLVAAGVLLPSSLVIYRLYPASEAQRRRRRRPSAARSPA